MKINGKSKNCKLKIKFKTTDFYKDIKNLKCKKLLNERWVEDEDKISSINKNEGSKKL